MDDIVQKVASGTIESGVKAGEVLLTVAEKKPAVAVIALLGIAVLSICTFGIVKISGSEGA